MTEVVIVKLIYIIIKPSTNFTTITRRNSNCYIVRKYSKIFIMVIVIFVDLKLLNMRLWRVKVL